MPVVKPLGQAQVSVSGTPTTVYTCPSVPINTVAEVGQIWICNTDTAERKITLRIGTGSLTSANSILDAVPVAANSTIMIDANQGITLTAGQKLEAFSDVASKVTVTAHGKEWP